MSMRISSARYEWLWMKRVPSRISLSASSWRSLRGGTWCSSFFPSQLRSFSQAALLSRAAMNAARIDSSTPMRLFGYRSLAASPQLDCFGFSPSANLILGGAREAQLGRGAFPLPAQHRVLPADGVRRAVQRVRRRRSAGELAVDVPVLPVDHVADPHLRGDVVGRLVDVPVDRRVRVAVDDAGRHVLARGVDDGRVRRGADRPSDLRDLAVDDQEVAPLDDPAGPIVQIVAFLTRTGRGGGGAGAAAPAGPGFAASFFASFAAFFAAAPQGGPPRHRDDEGQPSPAGARFSSCGSSRTSFGIVVLGPAAFAASLLVPFVLFFPFVPSRIARGVRVPEKETFSPLGSVALPDIESRLTIAENSIVPPPAR
jgi:hypothetical protein